MNKNNLIIRLIVSPFMLAVLLIGGVYAGTYQWLQFIWYGAEFVFMKKKENSKTIRNTYDLMVEKLKNL